MIIINHLGDIITHLVVIIQEELQEAHQNLSKGVLLNNQNGANKQPNHQLILYISRWMKMNQSSIKSVQLQHTKITQRLCLQIKMRKKKGMISIKNQEKVGNNHQKKVHLHLQKRKSQNRRTRNLNRKRKKRLIF